MRVHQVLYEILIKKKLTSASIKLLKQETITDKLYHLASKNHLLPALYNTIKKYNLEDYFPLEFVNACKYFQELNEERNQQIQDQIKAISILFNKHNIDYCFLKGAALLILNPYDHLSTRMIGDIDMLIDPNHLQIANSLLVENNYKIYEISPDPAYKNHRHLPRLVSKNYIAAVELHSHILEQPQDILKPKDILKNRQYLKSTNIPSLDHLWLHNVFNYQINDEAFLTWNFSFKSLYDALSLKPIEKTHQYLSKFKNKYIRRYWLVNSLYINEISLKPNQTESLKIRFIYLIYKYTITQNIYLKLIFLWNRKHTFLKRIWAFIFDKKYRRYVLKK